MKHKLIILLSLIFSISPKASTYETIIKHPNPAEKLQDRWNWAQSEAKKQKMKDGYWIGYSIERLMHEHSYIGCFYRDGRYKDKSLAKLIYGTDEPLYGGEITAEEAVSKAAKKELENWDKSRHKITKEVALLFRFNKKDHQVSELEISNMSLYVDLKELPLIWLGPANQEQSLELLMSLYDRLHNDDEKEDLITAVSIHDNQKQIIPFLKKRLTGDESGDIREKAAFWIGQQNSEDALGILLTVVHNDRSCDVREKAVFSISQMDIPAALEELIKLACQGKDHCVREKAIFWLGQKASDKAIATLKDVIYNDEDIELKEKAVFALSQLPDNQGVPDLIKIAKTYPHKEIRKKAIFWLGQSDDKRALEALIEIIRE